MLFKIFRSVWQKPVRLIRARSEKLNSQLHSCHSFLPPTITHKLTVNSLTIFNMGMLGWLHCLHLYTKDEFFKNCFFSDSQLIEKKCFALCSLSIRIFFLLFLSVFPFRVMCFSQGSWDFRIIQAQNCPDCLCTITKISLQTDQLCGNERTALSLCLFNSWPFFSDHPKRGCHKSDGVCVKWTLEVKFWPQQGQYFIWNPLRQAPKSFLRIAVSIRW